MKLNNIDYINFDCYGFNDNGGKADDMADMYFSTNNPKLTKQEKSAMAIANKMESNQRHRHSAITGANGTILFVYGVQQPSIVCAVLQVCDVALQDRRISQFYSLRRYCTMDILTRLLPAAVTMKCSI